MSQSRSLPSATAPSNSGARAHTRAYTKQLAELEPSLCLPIRQPEISPSGHCRTRWLLFVCLVTLTQRSGSTYLFTRTPPWQWRIISFTVWPSAIPCRHRSLFQTHGTFCWRRIICSRPICGRISSRYCPGGILHSYFQTSCPLTQHGQPRPALPSLVCPMLTWMFW